MGLVLLTFYAPFVGCVGQVTIKMHNVKSQLHLKVIGHITILLTETLLVKDHNAVLMSKVTHHCD